MISNSDLCYEIYEMSVVTHSVVTLWTHPWTSLILYDPIMQHNMSLPVIKRSTISASVTLKMSCVMACTAEHWCHFNFCCCCCFYIIVSYFCTWTQTFFAHLYQWFLIFMGAVNTNCVINVITFSRITSWMLDFVSEKHAGREYNEILI